MQVKSLSLISIALVSSAFAIAPLSELLHGLTIDNDKIKSYFDFTTKDTRPFVPFDGVGNVTERFLNSINLNGIRNSDGNGKSRLSSSFLVV